MKKIKLWGGAALTLSLGAVSTSSMAVPSATCDAVADGVCNIFLVAKQGDITMPDGAVIPIWGFAEDIDGNLATDDGETPTIPGPTIDVGLDTTLTIHVRNDLAAEPISIVIPGQTQMPAMVPVRHGAGIFNGRVRSFTHEAASAGTNSYTWDNFQPGTYTYHSGTHPQIQVQMGLYGAATRDAAAGEAYTGVTYTEDHMLFYSEIDPVLHDAVVNGDYDPFGDPAVKTTSTINYHPRYALINGQAFPATVPVLGAIGAATPQTVLLRFLSAGLESHTPIIQGLHADVIAEDGSVYPYPRSQYSLRVPAGTTRDALLDVDCSVLGTSGRHVIYDGRMNLTNAGAGPGGGRINLHLCAAPVDTDTDGLPDDQDNCITVSNPSQVDHDKDNFGTNCDGDFNNNGFVDFGDINTFRAMIGTVNPEGDFNNVGNGLVDFGDINIFRGFIGNPPGPSALAD